MPEYICPHCKKPIYDEEALLCLYCGGSLNRAMGFMGKIKDFKLKMVIVVIVLVVLFSFVILMTK